MLYLIAYDIADPKRLRRVARSMEKWATRCQKSVFLMRGDFARLEKAMHVVTPFIDRELDVVQAWRLSVDEDAEGWTLGAVRPICPASIVVTGSALRSIHHPNSGRKGRKRR